MLKRYYSRWLHGYTFLIDSISLASKKFMKSGKYDQVLLSLPQKLVQLSIKPVILQAPLRHPAIE